MGKVLSTLFIGLCLFLGNLSAQTKSYKILGHVAAEHSSVKHHKHTHHHHGKHAHHHHSHKSTKKTPTNDHHHDAELASLTAPLGIITQRPVSTFQNPQIDVKEIFLVVNESGLLSFSPSIFRPPIA